VACGNDGFPHARRGIASSYQGSAKEISSMHLRRVAPSIVLAGACALVAPSLALPDPGKTPPAGTLTASARLPKGYTIVRSGILLAPAGAQTRGEVDCPSPLVPLGGGVFVSSLSTVASVNSTFPTSTGWVAYVNNRSQADTGFSLSVICATRPRVYTLVESGTISNPVGQAQAFARCPKGMEAFSGGVDSSSSSLLVNVAATIVTTRGWTARENNASSDGDTIVAFAICGRLRGYAAIPGLTVVNPAGFQTFSSASCPAGSAVIGGGINTSSTSEGVDVNSSIVGAGEWDSYENNNTAVSAFELSEVECAGVAT
jgi:hypothetical protein